MRRPSGVAGPVFLRICEIGTSAPRRVGRRRAEGVEEAPADAVGRDDDRVAAADEREQAVGLGVVGMNVSVTKT